MMINVRVIPNAKHNKIIKEENRLKVYLTASPVDGKANKKLIEVLAEYYNVKKSEVRIVGGMKRRDKNVVISNSIV